jgi:hypothetical protein
VGPQDSRAATYRQHGAPQDLSARGRNSHKFLCVAFSAYKRVIADVAIFPVRGRWRKCADARRSNADRAVDMYMMGGGGSARIGVRCEMPRGYMVRASHSGSCEHGCGDQCSRQKFGFSHFVLHLAGPLLGLSNNQTCIRAPLFRNTSAYFRTRSREHKVTRPTVAPTTWKLGFPAIAEPKSAPLGA